MIESDMTYLLINNNQKVLDRNLVLLASKFLGKDFRNMEDLFAVPDIHIVDGRGSNSIGIDEIKALQNEMIYQPFNNSSQLAIILDSHKLTSQAQNSFLKTLEESSDNTIYILCVNNEKNLLQTIISRGKLIYAKGEVEKVIDDTPDILQLDLVEQFLLVEKVAKDKEASLGLIEDLERVFKKKLEFEIKNGKIESPKRLKNALDLLNDSKKKIDSNCNKKLVLEALIVSLNT